MSGKVICLCLCGVYGVDYSRCGIIKGCGYYLSEFGKITNFQVAKLKVGHVVNMKLVWNDFRS